MLVKCEQTDLALVCHLEGNLEQHTVAQFREAVSVLPSEQPVVFELSAVPFIDSAGLGALIGAIRRTRELGGEVAVCAPRPSVSRVLQMVGLPRIVTVTGSPKEAVEYFAGPAVA